MARERIGRKWGEHVSFTDDIKNKYLNILVWGRAGSGKTHFAGTAPRPFVIDTDGGTLTLHRSHVPSIRLTNETQVYETIMSILDDARKKKSNDVVDFNKIDTIVLDSVSKLSDLLLEELKEEANVTGKPGFDQWGELLTRMSKIIDGFASSNYHFIVTSGEAVRADEMDAEEKIVTFNFSGSYRNRLPYSCDLNLYLKATKRGKEMQFIANTMEENKRTAKSRVAIPRQIVDPSFKKIQDFVTEGLKEGA